MADHVIDLDEVSTTETYNTNQAEDGTKYLPPYLSIYPPAPLDSGIKLAFPNRRTAHSNSKAPSAWPYVLWNTFIVLLALGGSVFPLVIFYFDPGSPRYFDYAFSIISAAPLLFSLPVFFLFFLYRPPPPVVPAPPINEDTAVACDILVTSYKEELDELAGTLAAIQNIIWHGKINVYVLDDANRQDIADLCHGTKSCKYPITRITRNGNEGKKAGNINNFMKVMPRTADFFVILDCDMRPFPNMLQLLFGAYFDAPDDERARIGYITTPQFFRNYNHRTDYFDMVSTSWVNTLLPIFGNINTVPFIGTNALWKRDALERAGLFLTEYATEDVSTGCKVHTTENENGDKYISKYMPLPVAAGLNPRTLAELMDQHNRWNIGQAQMTIHYKFFWFCRGLSPVQKFAYFCTMAGWLRHIPTFFILWGGSIFFNVASAFIFKPNEAWDPSILTIAASVCSVVLPTLAWLLLPGATLRGKFRGIQMSLVYVTTEIAGALVILGFKVPVRFASEAKQSSWHPHFLFHFSVYFTILASAVFCVVRCIMTGVTNAVPYAQAGFLMFLWSFAFFPIARALFGHEDLEDMKWRTLENGRVDLFQTPVWSEMDKITFEQLKDTVARLYQKIEEQDALLKKLQTDQSFLS